MSACEDLKCSSPWRLRWVRSDVACSIPESWASGQVFSVALAVLSSLFFFGGSHHAELDEQTADWTVVLNSIKSSSGLWNFWELSSFSNRFNRYATLSVSMNPNPSCLKAYVSSLPYTATPRTKRPHWEKHILITLNVQNKKLFLYYIVHLTVDLGPLIIRCD